MSVISQTFVRCRAQRRAALIPYFMAGYPSDIAFCQLVEKSFEAGADIIEIGVPFSDPVADGPVIQRAGQVVLEHGLTVDRVFGLLRSLRLHREQPLVLMSYLNPILQYGLDRFVSESVKVGVSGLIVPDLVFEEGKVVEAVCRAAKVDLVYLLAPTSSNVRQRTILRRSRGFVYAVSVLGVTGMRTVLPDELYARIAELRSVSRIPIAIGFGISTPEIAAQAAQAADGIIVGSALIEQMKPELTEDEQVDRVIDLICAFHQSTYVNIFAKGIKRQLP